MPDTKIARTSDGWVDLDDTSKAYDVRWKARLARRHAQQGVFIPGPTSSFSPPSLTTSTFTAAGNTNGTVNVLTPLQQKLYDRLTLTQSVSITDAMDVVINNGYNKAASYGHMRAAGANHSEALTVISLDNPAISLSYGLSRAQGLNHTDALNKALKDDDD